MNFDVTAFIDDCVSAYKFGVDHRSAKGSTLTLSNRWDKLKPNQQEALHTYIVSTGDELIFMIRSRKGLFVNYCVKVAKVGRLNEPGESQGSA